MPSFSKKLVDFAATNSFSNLVLDYLSSSGRLDKFSSFAFSEKGFLEIIQQRNEFPVDRVLLKKIILEQYHQSPGQLSLPAGIEKNISLLEKSTTFTITTGHQLNLFTGPLYFIYKMISTINLVAQLSRTFPAYSFVPLYWMASEDHDLEEINHINLFGKKVEWKPASRGAAGRFKCTGISEVVDLLRGMLGNNVSTEKLLTLFSKAYDEKNTLSEATRIIIHELFSQYGLVVLDADDARFKRLFIPEMKDDIVNHTAFRLVGETIHELEENYKVQVHPREINLFYLGENSRERIVEEGGTYKVLNSEIKFSRQELLDEIEHHPEKFSPNVVLRPLYQEKILPGIAYIGGPAEISYWLEYKKMFEHYNARLPVLVLRNCVLVVDAGTREKIKKLGLAPEDILMNEEDLIKKYLKLKSPKEFSIETLVSRSESMFGEIVNEVTGIDPTLKASVEAEKQKFVNGLKALEERIRRAEKKKHENAINQIRKLKEKLFPENELQERHENLLTFYTMYGEDFLTALIRQLNPLEKKFVLLIED